MEDRRNYRLLTQPDEKRIESDPDPGTVFQTEELDKVLPTRLKQIERERTEKTAETVTTPRRKGSPAPPIAPSRGEKKAAKYDGPTRRRGVKRTQSPRVEAEMSKMDPKELNDMSWKTMKFHFKAASLDMRHVPQKCPVGKCRQIRWRDFSTIVENR